nr:immunoglobulin light chain junction region [Macaca mulatta]
CCAYTTSSTFIF